MDLRIQEILLKVSDTDFVKLNIMEINSFLDNYKKISEVFTEVLDNHLNKVYNSTWAQVGRFAELNDIYKNDKIYKIYQKSEIKNNKNYIIYLVISILFAITGLLLSVFGKVIYMKYFFISSCVLEYDINYWIMKAGIVFITVTGITFCLKQAIHHQKKKDEAKKMYLELEALPTYMFNFSDKQKNEVYKELTGRYFGRDSDNAVYQDMSNTVQEQIRLSHEVLKSALEKI